MRFGSPALVGLALGSTLACLPPSAQAGDFFSNLFGGFGGPPAPSRPLFAPFERDSVPAETPRHRASYGGGQAWCVRTCDGRYFPITGPDNKGRVESCNSFCPASETALVYGRDIDSAATENGKPYSELPNAFRYRKELVAGCTCNGKDPAGLAAVTIDNDPTLRKGDLIAGRKGLEVAAGNASPTNGTNFTPLPQSAQARLRNLPVVASGR